MCNQKPSIKEGETIQSTNNDKDKQWANNDKDKQWANNDKDKQWSTKHYQEKTEQHKPH